jgi:hypothetical protein
MRAGTLILAGALGLLLGSMDHTYETLEFWTVMATFVVYGYLQYTAGYEDATDLAQGAWRVAKTTLEEAIAREERVQQLIKEHTKELHNDTP